MNKKRIYPQWFLIIPLTLYIVFFLLPSVLGLLYSFTDWNARSLDKINFVGIQNYKDIFTSNKDYASGIFNTLKFTVISNVIKLIPALFIAIMLQEGLRGKNVYRTILYLPSILPFLIIGLTFKSIFNYNTGLLNTALDFFHLGFMKQKWLSDLDVVWKSIFGETMEQVSAKGDYFAMNSRNMKLRDFRLAGNYSFDGVKNMEIHNAKLLSKDAFWNSENVTVYDSFISGEYLGWNAKNLTLINCTIESLQGMCYIDNLVMKNCKLINTNLAFEYSTVDAEITGKIDSVLNPASGIIRAEYIEELIVEKDKVDPTKTKIICKRIDKESECA